MDTLKQAPTPEQTAEAQAKMAVRRAGIAEAAGQTALLPAWQREAYEKAFETAEQEARDILATNRW